MITDDIARQQFGERLYPLVQLLQEPLLAEKITGMLLELPLATLEELCSDAVALSNHVTRCVDVLEKQSQEETLEENQDGWGKISKEYTGWTHRQEVESNPDEANARKENKKESSTVIPFPAAVPPH